MFCILFLMLVIFVFNRLNWPGTKVSQLTKTDSFSTRRREMKASSLFQNSFHHSSSLIYFAFLSDTIVEVLSGTGTLTNMSKENTALSGR